MADLNVIYRIAADITGLQDGVQRAAEATEGLESTVSRVGKAILGAFSVHQVLEFGRETTQAFAEEEAALKRLETALLAQGTLTPALSKQYADLAAEFQRTTAFSDDLIMEMQALLVQIGDVAPKDMRAALTAATDLSAGLGIDLRAATVLVGKAFEGETGTLKKYGIVIDEAKLKAGGISAVLDAIHEKFGGQAQAQVQTYTGQVAQLGNQMNDSQEKIGGFLAKGLTPMLGLFNQLPEPLKIVVGGVQALTPNLETLALAFLAIGGPAKAGAMTTAALGGLTTVLTALWPIVAVGATAFVAWKLGTWLGEITHVTDAIEWLTGRLMGLSTEQINASRAARDHAKDLTGLTAALKIASANAKLLDVGPGLKSVALSGEEVTAVIKEMDAKLRESNEQARQRAAESKQRAAEEKRLLEDYNRALGQNIAIELQQREDAWTARAKLSDKAAEYEMKRLADVYQETVKQDKLKEQVDRDYHEAIDILIAEDLERTKKANDEKLAHVRSTFSQMSTAIQGHFASMLLGTQGFKEGFLGIWDELKAGVMRILAGMLGDFTDKFLKGIFDAILGSQGAFAGAFNQSVGGAFSGVLNGLGQMFGKWIASIVGALTGMGGAGAATAAIASTAAESTAAATGGAAAAGVGLSAGTIAATAGIAAAGVGLFYGIKAWMGQRESMAVNDLRDAWFAAHGGLGGINAIAMNNAGLSWPETEALDKAIFAADRKDEFAAAVANWERATGVLTGMATGGLVRQPMLAMLGEAGPELVTPLDQLSGFGFTQPEIVIHSRIDVDGRMLARSTARHLPSVLATQGVPTT